MTVSFIETIFPFVKTGSLTPSELVEMHPASLRVKRIPRGGLSKFIQAPRLLLNIFLPPKAHCWYGASSRKTVASLDEIGRITDFLYRRQLFSQRKNPVIKIPPILHSRTNLCGLYNEISRYDALWFRLCDKFHIGHGRNAKHPLEGGAEAIVILADVDAEL